MKKLVVFIFSLVILGSCTKEENIPVLSTKPIVYDLTNNAETGGVITSDGGSQVTVKGVCWSNSSNPTIDDDTTINGTGVESFDSYISNLNLNSTYYVRAYATNSNGTGYGDELSFNTLSGVPSLTTLLVDNITTGPTSNILGASAETGGVINSNGGITISVKGVCYSKSPNPTILNNRTEDGAGDVPFSSLITGLESNTTYYVRAYATNSIFSSNIGYGNELSFTTGDVIGDTLFGGIVFYLDGNGGGLVCSFEDQAMSSLGPPNPVGAAEWGCSGYDVSGADGIAIGTGFQNTMDIVAYLNAYPNCSASNPNNLLAARICDNLSLGGYNDWFLPSKDELNLMYQNLHLPGGGNFYVGTNTSPWGVRYWSSSEEGFNEAWCQDFNTGNQQQCNKDSYTQGTGYVRAIRAF